MLRSWLRALLRAYPATFRDRYGDELVEFWSSQAAEPRYRGRLGRLRLGAEVTFGALVAGLRMRWIDRESTRREGDMTTLVTDLGHAVRIALASPRYTMLAACTLALGIGATTAVFAVVEGVVLRPLPYPEPDRLVRVLRVESPSDDGTASWPDFRDWREEGSGVARLVAYAEVGSSFEWEDGAEALVGAIVTSDFFDVMGVPLALGRTFSAGEDRLGGSSAVILSHAVWSARFGADPAVIGRTVPIEGEAVPVVGVAAPGFEAPVPGVGYWMPLQDDQLLVDVGLDAGARHTSFLEVMARIAPGVGIDAAQAELRALAQRIDETTGKTGDRMSSLTLVPLGRSLVADVRETLFFLLAASALVLIVAAANVAGLALGRTAGRARELSVRVALGASRARLVRQLVCESAVLAALAGMIGVGVASALLAVLARLAPPGLPRADALGLTPETLGFALAATLASGLLYAALPAGRAGRTAPLDGLAGGRGAEGGPTALRPQQALVVVQLALAVVLTTGAALLLESFSRLVDVDRGYDTSVVVATVAASSRRHATPSEVSALYETLLERIRAIPSVRSASTTYSPPLFGNQFWTGVRPEGAEPDDGSGFLAGTVVVSPGYFETSGIALLRGRDFGPQDRLGEPPVVIVNRQMADRMWPGEDPVGKRFEFDRRVQGSVDSFVDGFFPDQPFTVVGVAGDVRRSSLDEAPEPEYYRPHTQIAWAFQYLLVRTTDDVDAFASTLREAVWSVDRTIPAPEVRTLQAQLDDTVSAPRFRMLLLAAFAVLTAFLSAVGLYAVMTLAVARRRREMGIRLALGASRGDVVGWVLRRGLRLVGVGTVVGALAAWAAARTLSSMLFEVRPAEPLTYALVIAATAAVGLTACWAPARRAGRVDPVESLQES